MTLFSSSCDNHNWPGIFGTAAFFPQKPKLLLAIRLFFLGTFLYHTGWSLSKGFDQGYWFMYLTNWSLIVETSYFGFAAYTTWAALHGVGGQDGRKIPEPRHLPVFVKATWILYHVAVPAALTVFLLNWTLNTPLWALTGAPGYLDMFVHGLNFFVLLADVILGRNVFYLRYSGFFLIYILTYLAWSLIHYAAGVGTFGCRGQACPLYGALDWTAASRTAVIVAIVVLVVVPLVQLPIWWCVLKRRVAVRSAMRKVACSPEESTKQERTSFGEVKAIGATEKPVQLSSDTSVCDAA